MKISEFLSDNFQFLVVKFLIHLNRHVFVIVVKLSFGVSKSVKVYTSTKIKVIR